MVDVLMLLTTRAVPPFYKNGYLLGCETTREAVVIDPGDEIDALIQSVTEQKLIVKHILLTHAHLDHITGVAPAQAAFSAPVYLHAADQPLYDAILQQGQMFGIPVERQPPIDRFYQPGERIAFGRYEAVAHHTPGHSPGGVCLEIREGGRPARHLCVGDTLFAGSIGRTDLPGGDYATLIESIRNVLFAFDDDATVYPGHGAPTSIGRERRTNPFLLPR